MSLSTKVFLGLLFAYALAAGLNLYLPQGDMGALQPAAQNLPAPQWVLALASAGLVLVIYGILGFAGLWFSRKIGFPEILDPTVSNKRRFLIPGLVGGGLGLFLIAGDLVFSRFNGIGHFIHPPFPTSLVASFSAGFGEELMFRLFFISFWVWLVSRVILRGKFLKPVFWTVAVVSALAFAVGHYPALMLILGLKSTGEMSLALQAEIILLNGAVGMFCAYYFRKSGFLAAASVHFWTDIVWHVIYGLIMVL